MRFVWFASSVIYELDIACDEQKCGDADQQHQKCYWVVIKEVSNLCLHNAPPEVPWC
jgi:hypothetical protein